MLPYLGIKKGARALWYSELSLYQLDSRPTVFVKLNLVLKAKVKHFEFSGGGKLRPNQLERSTIGTSSNGEGQ